MSEEQLQYKIDIIKEKKEEIQKCKEDFKINVGNLFLNFKNESFIPILEKIKTDANYKFSDYINEPKMKLKESNDNVDTALSNLKNEIDQIIRTNNDSYKSKYENLNAKINIEIAKIKGLIIEYNSKLKELNLKIQVLQDKKISIEDIAKPTSLITGSIGLTGGFILGIVTGVGFCESFVGAVLAGSGFAGIGAIIGGIGSIAGYGFYNLWKSFNKEDDLIDLTKKAKEKFSNDYDNFYRNERQKFDEYQKKVIDEVYYEIDKNIMIMENSMKQILEATTN